MTELTQEHLDKSLKEQTKELKTFVKQENEELAQMVNAGFDHVNNQLQEIKKDLDARERMEILEKDMARIKEALHIK